IRPLINTPVFVSSKSLNCLVDNANSNHMSTLLNLSSLCCVQAKHKAWLSYTHRESEGEGG
ncbi:unnamed protein product, partial [Ceratitis capitata]